MKMHDNEVNIDKDIIYQLLSEQKPEWAMVNIVPISSDGSDHALFRLGSEYVMRLPRVARAVKGIDKEVKWVSALASHLSTPISEPIFKGAPSEQYPFPWLVNKWCEGHNPDFEKNNEYSILATELAEFLNQLHGIKIPDGPISRRGVALNYLNTDVKVALKKIDAELDVSLIVSLWQQLMNTDEWIQEPAWLHGDFLQGNILVNNHHLSGVIDFSDLGMGDPACDLIIAWSLLNKDSRKTFKDNLDNIDENTWQRGRGWALSIALIMLSYYKDRSPYFTTLAKHMIRELTSECS